MRPPMDWCLNPTSDTIKVNRGEKEPPRVGLKPTTPRTLVKCSIERASRAFLLPPQLQATTLPSPCAQYEMKM